MLRETVVRNPGRGLFAWGVVAGLFVLAGFGTVILSMLPAVSVSDGSFNVLVAYLLFFLILCAIVGSATAQHVGTRRMIYRLALTLWWVLLVDEVYFARLNTSYAMGHGEFSINAYGEATMWCLCMAVLLALTMKRPQYLRQMIAGSAKWLVLFIGLCLLSAAWAPGPLYSLIWGFKLVLVFLLLQLCSSLMESVGDVTVFLKVTAAAFFFLSVVPVFTAMNDPSGFFAEGRLNADPDLLGPTAASFMLISLILYTITKKQYFALTLVIGALVMFLAFGKAGIVGGFLGILIFVLLQRKVVRSLGLFLGLGFLALIVISVTPLGNYLQHYEGGSTLTGRTLIWHYAVAAIRSKPLLGYGYLGTYFSFQNTSGLVAGAVHLHNGFLEVFYNNGLVGEFLLLTCHFVILRNLFSGLRTSLVLRRLRPNSEEVWCAYLLLIGTLALYVHTFIQGLFGGHFGGRCMTPYMLWLSIFMLAETIRRIIERLASPRMSMSARQQMFAATSESMLTFAPGQE
jgi:hypothetical protein